MFKEHTAKRLTDEFPDESGTNRGVSKLLKKLRDADTVGRRPGSGRPRRARAEENIETVNDLKPNFITLAGSKMVRSWSTGLAVRYHGDGIHLCTQNAICLHFSIPANICRKFDFLISQGSAAACLM